MLRRFAAATCIPSIGIAIAACVVMLIPGVPLQRFYPIVTLWCFAPLAWGLWALLAPAAWVPQRLPLWGAGLGLIAGALAMFVLNLPARMYGQPVSPVVRGAGLAVLVVFYYLLWMLVRLVYRALAGPPAQSGKMAAAA